MVTRRPWVLAAVLVSVSVSAGGTDPSGSGTVGCLRIVVEDLASNEGNVRFYLHRASTFNTKNLSKLEKGDCLELFVAEIHDNEAVWRTDPLPFGEYAVIVHHDVNGDGIVNFGRILPLEPVGYSNYEHAIASYPDFDKARISLDAGLVDVRVDAYMQGHLFRKYLRK